jgi:2-amino-4-hydroxy-6-hydroxymethyldihydropteridine diphosphokinase
MLDKVVLGLGSNTGNRFLNLKKTMNIIYFSQDISILAVSPVYETEPWGFKNQNNFLNCIIIALYRRRPSVLLKDIKIIEKKAGRKSRGKWKEREIDIDVLFFGTKKYKSKNLRIPHPQLQNRNFVLKPLADLIPDFIHPVSRKKIKDLFKLSNDAGKVNLYKKHLTK